MLEYQLRTQRLGQAGKLWQLLVNMANLDNGWDVFSRDTATGSTEEVSLESWHDDIHNLIGSGRNAKGNMGMIEIAGVSLKLPIPVSLLKTSSVRSHVLAPPQVGCLSS